MSYNISPLSLSIQTRLSNKILQIPTRFYLAPINTGFAPNGKPNAKFIEFYKKRSGKYIGITYIGNVSIDKAWRTNSNTPWLSPETLEIWEDLSSAINKNGSLPGIQLACRQSSKEPFKGWKRDDAKFFIDKLSTQFSKIPKDEIYMKH
jgi:2,4-dienoyl-CoA reductase-like NADH-dependent reductase (Old Yellow Enzyme family)